MEIFQNLLLGVSKTNILEEYPRPTHQLGVNFLFFLPMNFSKLLQKRVYTKLFEQLQYLEYRYL